MPILIEAGHYYEKKGPTIWSQIGWGLVELFLDNSQEEHDIKRMLFIDNVHEITDVNPHESNLPNIEFNPKIDYLVLESKMNEFALKILAELQSIKLPKRSRARKQNGGAWFCSGFPITHNDGRPKCILLDAGLTLYKQQLGFDTCINIVPFFYEEEQMQLLKIIKKAIPNFTLRVILYKLDGTYKEINNY